MQEKKNGHNREPQAHTNMAQQTPSRSENLYSMQKKHAPGGGNPFAAQNSKPTAEGEKKMSCIFVYYPTPLFVLIFLP